MKIIKGTLRYYKKEWIATILIMGLMLLTFEYVDHISMTIWSTNFWDTLFSGTIYSFYEYTGLNLHDVPHQYCASTFISFLPWAIWNFPIWLLQRFEIIDIATSPIALLWSKLFLIIVLVMVLAYTYRIVMLIQEDKNKAFLAQLLTASSIYVSIGIGYAAQSDILWIAVGLLAVYYYMLDKEGLFLFFSAISILFKPHFIILCIALILLREKNIIKAAIKLLLVCSGNIVFLIIFANAPGYAESMSGGVSRMIMGGYLLARFPTPFGEASILCFALVLIYALCYFTESKDKAHKLDYVIYLCFAINLIWILVGYENYYRTIILIPYLFIIIAVRKELFEINMWLDLVLGGVLMFIHIMTKSSIFNINFVMDEAVINFSKLGNGIIKHESIYSMINADQMELLQVGVRGGFVAVGVILLIINFPGFTKYIQRDFSKCPKWLVWMHILEIVPFVLLTYLCALGVI